MGMNVCETSVNWSFWWIFVAEFGTESRCGLFSDIIFVVNDSNFLWFMMNWANWYRQPTRSGRLKKVFSSHPKSQKIGIIYMLEDKALNLSHKTYHTENLKICHKYTVAKLLLKGIYIKIYLRNIKYHRVPQKCS